jgi:hypothetical protein
MDYACHDKKQAKIFQLITLYSVNLTTTAELSPQDVFFYASETQAYDMSSGITPFLGSNPAQIWRTKNANKIIK